jgi:hypothetical protein
MKEGRERKYDIMDGVIILAAVVFLCLRFSNSRFFPVVLLVSVPFALYALKIIFLEGKASSNEKAAE